MKAQVASVMLETGNDETSVVQVGRRLAILYDGNVAEQMPTGVKSHMNRDVGLAWLDLPPVTPALR